MDAPIIPQKPCSKCKRLFPATTEYFMAHKGGLYSQCHECRKMAKRASHERNAVHNNARSAAWYAENKEQESVKRSAKHAANPQPARDRVKAWRLANPDKRRAADKRYRERHPEAAKRRAARHVERHPERRSELKRKRRKANPDKIRAAERLTYARNAEYYRLKSKIKSQKRRLKVTEVGGSFTQADIDLQLKSQRGKCWYCGKPFENNLLRAGKPRVGYDIEHRIPLDRGGTNDPGNIVLACPSCNCSKGTKLPHEWGNRLL